MLFILIFLITQFYFFVRLLRWLAIFQQKEYRFDRLNHFLRTAEGKQSFWHLVIRKNDISRTGLKRPVRTARMYFLFVCVIALHLFLSVWIWQWYFFEPAWFSLIVAFLMMASYYLFVPLLIMVSMLPSWVVSKFVVWMTLVLAQQKVKKYHPTIVGITGSYGKSSTKHILTHVLRQKFKVFTTPLSFNTKYSIARSILKSYEGEPFMVLEYGAYTQGEIKTLAKWFSPSIAILTGLAPQHLELFGTVENIVKAKAELVRSLPAQAPVFCNAEDPGTMKICVTGGSHHCIEVTGKHATTVFDQAKLSDEGKLMVVWKSQAIQTQLIGLHYQDILALAIAVADHLKLSTTEIMSGLTSFKPGEGFVRQWQKKGISIIDDGRTSNPTGFLAAINLLKPGMAKTVLVTAGIIDLGSSEKSVHLQLAKAAKEKVNEVWYLGDAGKSEFKEIFQPNFYTTESINQRFELLKAGDTILLEGRIPAWLEKKLK